MLVPEPHIILFATGHNVPLITWIECPPPPPPPFNLDDLPRAAHHLGSAPESQTREYLGESPVGWRWTQWCSLWSSVPRETRLPQPWSGWRESTAGRGRLSPDQPKQQQICSPRTPSVLPGSVSPSLLSYSMLQEWSAKTQTLHNSLKYTSMPWYHGMNSYNHRLRTLSN